MTALGGANQRHVHMGRSRIGHPLEDECPCGKAACGLVDSEQIHAECPQHTLRAAKRMRQMHLAADCEGTNHGREFHLRPSLRLPEREGTPQP